MDGIPPFESKLFTPNTKVITSQHLTMTVFGDTDTRRTAFALRTAPEPIFYFHHRAENWEKGREGAESRNINFMSFGGNPPVNGDVYDIIKWAYKEREKFRMAFAEACEYLTTHPGGTMVWDLSKDVRSLLVLSFFGDYNPEALAVAIESEGGKVNRFRAAQWGPVEAMWNTWLSQSKSRDKYHMIFIEAAGDEWKGAKTTGRKILKCATKIDTASRCVLKMEIKRDNKTKKNKFVGTIVKPEPLEMIGELENVDFATVASLVLGREKSEFEQ